jgi:hypothetical protein
MRRHATEPAGRRRCEQQQRQPQGQWRPAEAGRYKNQMQVNCKDRMRPQRFAAIRQSEPEPRFFPSRLWSDGSVAVVSATLMEAVPHHALYQQKTNDRQNDYDQQISDSEAWRLWFSRCRGV